MGNNRYPYVRYTPDAKYIIQSANNSRTPGIGIRIWDGQSGKLLQEIPGDVWKLAVSPDSKHFAISENQKVIVWQLK